MSGCRSCRQTARWSLWFQRDGPDERSSLKCHIESKYERRVQAAWIGQLDLAEIQESCGFFVLFFFSKMFAKVFAKVLESQREDATS